MAQTFSQQHMQEIKADGLSSKHFMEVALKTSLSLGWTIARKNDVSFTAYTNNGAFHWNAEIQLRVDEAEALIISRSHNIRTIEPGRDKKNIDGFISKFNEIKESTTSVQFEEVYMEAPSKVA